MIKISETIVHVEKYVVAGNFEGNIYQKRSKLPFECIKGFINHNNFLHLHMIAKALFISLTFECTIANVSTQTLQPPYSCLIA